MSSEEWRELRRKCRELESTVEILTCGVVLVVADARRQRIRLQRVRRRGLRWADPGRECSLVKDTGFVERAPRHAAAYRTRQGHPFGGAIHQPDAGSHYTAIQQRDTDAGRADPVGRDRRTTGSARPRSGYKTECVRQEPPSHRADPHPHRPAEHHLGVCGLLERAQARAPPTRGSRGRVLRSTRHRQAHRSHVRRCAQEPGMLQWAPRSAEHGNDFGPPSPDHPAHPSTPTQGNPTLESPPTERYRTTRHSHLQQSTPEPGQRQPATTHDSRAQNRG